MMSFLIFLVCFLKFCFNMIFPFTVKLEHIIIVCLFVNRNPHSRIFCSVEKFQSKKINQIGQKKPDFEISSRVKKNK